MGSILFTAASWPRLLTPLARMLVSSAPNQAGSGKAMTVSLNVNLVGNIGDGVLIANARVRKAGKTIFVSSCDVTDSDGNLLATGEVVGRYGPGSHLSEGIEAPSTADGT